MRVAPSGEAPRAACDAQLDTENNSYQDEVSISSGNSPFEEDSNEFVNSDTMDASTLEELRLKRLHDSRGFRVAAFVLLLAMASVLLPGLREVFTFDESLILVKEDDLNQLNEQLHIDVVISSCTLVINLEPETSAPVAGAAAWAHVELFTPPLFVHSEVSSSPYIGTTTQSQNRASVKVMMSSPDIIQDFLPCLISISISNSVNASKFDIDILSKGAKPTTVAFGNGFDTPIGSLSISGPNMIFYTASNISSPARRLSAHISHGSINVTSLTGADTANITAVSADIEVRSSWDMYVHKISSPRSHFVLVGNCIYSTSGGMHCFDGEQDTSRLMDDFKNASTLDGVLLKADQSRNSLNRTVLHASSSSGTIYLASCIPERLHRREFLIASGQLYSTWHEVSEQKLSQVQNWMKSAPEEDALVIIDVSGPNVAQRKWIYATKEPYIEIEPAWLFILSFGVLSARQQHLQIRVASAEWPFADSFRHNYTSREAFDASGLIPIISNTLPATKSVPNVVDGRSYRLMNKLQKSMNASLLADVLAFKTDDYVATLVSDGPGIYSMRTISWVQNRFLLPAVILSLLAASIGSVFVTQNILTHLEGIMKSHVKRMQIGARVKYLTKKLELSRKGEEMMLNDEEAQAVAEQEISQLKKAGLNILRRRLNIREIHGDAIKKTINRRKAIGLQSSDSIRSLDSDKIKAAWCRCCSRKQQKHKNDHELKEKGRKSIKSLPACDLFNEIVPEKDNIIESLSLLGNSVNDIQNALQSNVSVDVAKDEGQRKAEGTEMNVLTGIQTEASDTDSRKFRNEHDRKKKMEGKKETLFDFNEKKAYPSPFELPTVLWQLYMASNKNSLHDFLCSPSTFNHEESSMWSTNGLTTLSRFQEIYGDWCDSHDRKREIIEDSLDDLERFGISLISKLEQSVTNIRWTTKAERRKNNRERLHRGDYSPKQRFRKLYIEKARVYWEAAEAAQDKLRVAEKEFDMKSTKNQDKESTAKWLKLKQTLTLESDLMHFKAAEVAYKYFFYDENMITVTDDENDTITYDDIAQNMSSFFSKKHLRNKQSNAKKANGIPVPATENLEIITYQLGIKTDGVFDNMTVQQDPREALYFSPLHIAQDPRFGYEKLTRVNTYMLQGVEVLTEKELMDRRRQKFLEHQNSKLFWISQFVSTRFTYYSKMLTEGFQYVIASTLACFCIPLPLCALVLAHQSYYFRTTATTDELIPEIIFVSHLFNFEYFLKRAVRPHNIAVLGTAIIYYILCVVKLCLFFLDVPMTTCIRRCVRKLWVSFSLIWIGATVAWLLVVMEWVCLGAVLNPTAVLAHSVAVASSVGFMSNMWKDGVARMNRLKGMLKQKIEERLSRIMNSKDGPLWKKMVANLNLKSNTTYTNLLDVRIKTETNLNPGGTVSNLGEKGVTYSKNLVENGVASLKALNANVTEINNAIGDAAQPAPALIPALVNNEQDYRHNLFLRNRNVPKITPAVAFKLSDVDGNGELTIEEFQGLLEDLGLHISESRALRIFASSDRGNGGSITFNEFINLWKKLQDLIVKDALINTGLSKQAIIHGLLICFVVLTVLFLFLFLSVSAFGGAGSFGATVRASMALAASKLSSSVGFKMDPSKRSIEAAARQSLQVYFGKQVP